MIRQSFRRLFRSICAGALVLAACWGIGRFAAPLIDLGMSLETLAQIRAALVVAGAMTGAWFGSGLVQLIVTAAMLRKGKRPSRLLFQLITAASFVVVAVGVATSVSDGALTGALATSGVLFAVVGFALRNVIADVFSGIALSVESPYRIGDWVETEHGVSGRVVEINWRATRIETRNQVHVVVPNGRMAEGRLTNYSAPRPYYRTQIAVTLDFATPVVRAKRILHAAVTATRNIRARPAPDVRTEGYAERGMKYVVRYWIESYADELDCRDAVLSNIDRFLRSAGIVVPVRGHMIVERPADASFGDQPSRVEALGALPPFVHVPAEALRNLASGMSVRLLRPREQLASSVERGDHVHVLVEGLLGLRDETGERATLEPGAIAGPIKPGAGKADDGLSLVAHTDSLVYALPERLFKAALSDSGPLGKALREGMKRWQSLLDVEPRGEEMPSAPASAARPAARLMRLRRGG